MCEHMRKYTKNLVIEIVRLKIKLRVGRAVQSAFYSQAPLQHSVWGASLGMRLARPLAVAVCYSGTPYKVAC